MLSDGEKRELVAEDESLWDAMERLRLSTVAGMDRLEAGIAEIKEHRDA
ncbi:hypothetical protein MUN77_01520 [Leucobacter allii]|nr:hypothetical protein [Leucobacter allii]UOR02038.1 hypothetical protein MUN77_01520 [Leucobacter allii]